MTLIDKLREALSRQTKKTSLKETTEYGSKEKELPVPLMKKRELETIEVEHEFRLLKSDRAKFDYLVYLQTREDSLSPETKQKMLDLSADFFRDYALQTLEKGTDRGDVYFEPRGWSRTSAIVQELARRTQNQDSIKSIIQASFIKGDHQFARDLTDQLKDGKEFLKTLARSLPSKSLGWRIFYLEKADDEKELEEARIALLLENVKNAHQWECSYSFAKMYEKRMLEQYPESLAQIYEAVGKPLEAIKIRRLISKQVTSPAS